MSALTLNKLIVVIGPSPLRGIYHNLTANDDTAMKFGSGTLSDALNKIKKRPPLRKSVPNAIFRLGYHVPVPLRGIYHNFTGNYDTAMKFDTGTLFDTLNNIKKRPPLKSALNAILRLGYDGCLPLSMI